MGNALIQANIVFGYREQTIFTGGRRIAQRRKAGRWSSLSAGIILSG
jgi:hypothetical protein